MAFHFWKITSNSKSKLRSTFFELLDGNWRRENYWEQQRRGRDEKKGFLMIFNIINFIILETHFILNPNFLTNSRDGCSSYCLEYFFKALNTIYGSSRFLNSMSIDFQSFKFPWFPKRSCDLYFQTFFFLIMFQLWDYP